MNSLRKWFNQKSFHYSQFSNINELIEKKEERNLKISLCLPTLNEGKTIGKTIEVVQTELVERYALIDEIAVIDSGSEDNTLEIAKQRGAKTYLSKDYLLDEGKAKGKGENLWKALYLLEGDIILYLDADITNISPHFAYGVLGPLLHDTTIKFVKAFYTRPLHINNHIHETNGGRTTEILVRPLLCQFFPELTGFVQPLSGEFAAYRTVFEKLPFPVGYGVELAHLIDIIHTWGLDVMAQVDLDKRIHRNQSTQSLSKMSFSILQTIWKRLYKYQKIGPINPNSLTLRQIEKLDSKYNINEYEIVENERRPMIEVPIYQSKFYSNL